MLIDFSVQNYKSFNSKQELSMVASTSTKESYNLDSVKEVNNFGIKSVLKSAAIFGANASGKSNLTNALYTFKAIVLKSLESIDDKSTRMAVPFLLKENYFDENTEFEVTFLAKENLYRYGISIKGENIAEEWLYWTKSSRETQLFHREGQSIKFNQRSFPEAKSFVNFDGNTWVIEKTKSFVPFLTVLSQFNGEKSVVVTDWFQDLRIVSGLNDYGFKDFTTNLFAENSEFKNWSLGILESLQIKDIVISEVEENIPFPKSRRDIDDIDLNDAIRKLEGFIERTKIKKKKIEIIKSNKKTGEIFSFPLSFESEGTKKLIYLLGPLFDVIKNEKILVIDEFDNKFHTLLCKFIIELYNKNNHGSSQMIITCHDTNLLTKDLFRRDQIWFIEKNDRNESEIYSLVEYKEHYTRKEGSYSKDYLFGKYGAIPLFSSVDSLGVALNG
ncbi:AAA family ATPase [Dickeya dianthicola]|uniref:AAA family ATPase n=1 Tax=Dickeya dianthicola TaxID=204039 RepID=UPI0003A9ECEE|nr:ATP-binding protein [Dickeya dianthicola]ATO32946.1 abortive infection protein, putative [Dickeya dianthicola RNS04.9]MBI0439124.1 ATP-binding protein [Dickeya dianthicola]MBI0449375.1 ATP-binding protein [Dickeya dianthicola]MBI0453896.1 ATP-binding protein [Dickeya dianthicola]MBI0458116.1 ATP-binding protein [Dickeya dianthicola]